MIVPVVNPDNGEAKNAAAFAISSGSPKRFIATFVEIISSTFFLFLESFYSQTDPLKSIFPGAIAFILIPDFAKGFEMFFT